MTKYYSDGSGFSGVSSALCVLDSKNGHKLVKVLEENKSAIYMETLALLECLNLCENESEIYIDCKILEGYINRNWTSHLSDIELMCEEIRKLMKEKNCKLFWISRWKNLAGLYLSERIENLRRYKFNCTNFHKENKKWRRQNRR